MHGNFFLRNPRFCIFVWEFRSFFPTPPTLRIRGIYTGWKMPYFLRGVRGVERPQGNEVGNTSKTHTNNREVFYLLR